MVSSNRVRQRPEAQLWSSGPGDIVFEDAMMIEARGHGRPGYCQSRGSRGFLSMSHSGPQHSAMEKTALVRQ